ncbi:MAG: class I SAM-dependent DNA methyltransferase [Candidatus Promineifilaceae bacterium]
MNDRQYALGQFETPLDVADILNGLGVRRPGDRVLDPGCGEGSVLERTATWLQWLGSTPSDGSQGDLVGIEANAQAAELARKRVPQATILDGSFLTFEPGDLSAFDAIVGNPPYAAAERSDRTEEERAHQLSIFSWDDDTAPVNALPLATRSLTDILGSRSGQHAYFLAHSAAFLREGGRLAFVVPNGWLDVAYGADLKQYLLDHYRIAAIIESAVERWYAQAWINTCIVYLEKCSNLNRRRNNLVRMARLKQPLVELLPYSAPSPQRFAAIERLVERLLPGQSTVTEEADIHVREQRTLTAERKWGMTLRAPMIFRHHRDHLNLAPLRTWAEVQRGYTTGANEFFYLNADVVAQWRIEPQFRLPLLKSLRGVDRLEIAPEETPLEVLLVPPDTNLEGTAVASYIQWGEEQGFQKRRTCANRQPWYSLQPLHAAPLIMPKGIWHRHFAPLLSGDVTVDQQLYQIVLSPYMPLRAIAALLNSAWFALQVELRGRVSFGKGLLWLAAYELEDVQLPDPRQFSDVQVERLTGAFDALAGRPMSGSLEELAMPDRRELDEAVFDILGFSARERKETLDSLVDRLASRIQRAR